MLTLNVLNDETDRGGYHLVGFHNMDRNSFYAPVRFHGGRTNWEYAHRDLLNRSGLGDYHFHHGIGPHLHPCGKISDASLIDLLISYNGSVFTTTRVSSETTTYVFEGIIELEKNKKYFALELVGTNGTFYLAYDGTKTVVENFWGTELNPVFVYKEDSPWCGATGGFDFLVNSEYFHAMIKKYCGLEKPAEGSGKVYVTLSQLKHDKFIWKFREITGYDLSTSIPTYTHANGDGRDITQSDVDEINRVLHKYEINTPNRICHFLAQCYAETDGGKKPVEQFDGDPFEYFRDYETGEKAGWLGNTEKDDGANYRGAGAIQVTGRANYKALSEDPTIRDPQILNDGALYVGQKYFWESAGHYWSVYKPGSAPTDIFDLNKKCDENASVRDITSIINAGLLKLSERQAAYEHYKSVIK